MDYKSSALVPALYLVLAVSVVGVACLAFVVYRPEPGQRVTEQLAAVNETSVDPRLSRPADASGSSVTQESYAKAVQRNLQLEEALEKRSVALEQQRAELERQRTENRELKEELENYVMLLSESSPAVSDPPSETPVDGPTGVDATALLSQLAELRAKLAETEAAGRELQLELDQAKSDLTSALAEMAERDLAAAVVAQDNAIADVSARTLVGMGPVVIPTIVELLTDRRAEVRAWAADILGEFGSLAEDAVPPLREALTDPEPRVRAAAERSLNLILD